MHGTVAHEESAFTFEGTWREFAPIAFSNLLLTIVTLGIYRFWATARARKYLWSRTHFIGDELEWTGTGKELFIGFVLVLAVFLLPLILISQVAQAMLLRGEVALGIGLVVASWLTIFYLAGLARYRALRYRLSRTRWRGIRGGSDDAGFGYGITYMWKTVAGYVLLGLLMPWSMTSLWNDRWNRLSFGPHKFRAEANWRAIFRRYLLLYLSFPAALIAIGVFMGADFQIPEKGSAAAALYLVTGVLIFYLIAIILSVSFFAKFYREVIGETRWDSIQFKFNASSLDWFKLMLGNIALVVLTLGIGAIFLSYRNWKFFITHLNAHGEIALDTLTQSTARMDSHGEGLLDALDIGAI